LQLQGGNFVAAGFFDGFQLFGAGLLDGHGCLLSDLLASGCVGLLQAGDHLASDAVAFAAE
jgi:hypothetical protein